MSERETTSAAALEDAKRELLARLLAEEGLVSDVRAIPRRAPNTAPPLTHAQEVLWLLDRATPGLIAYNTPAAFRLRGPLDVAALQRALDALVARHESLRTHFESRHEHPVQVVDSPAPVPLVVEDLRAHPAESREEEAASRLRAHARRAFDLTRDHLLHTALVRLTDDESLLLLLTHHIVSDAWSYGVMVHELSALYAAARAGRAATLPEPAIQFGDYAVWERTELTGDRLRERLAYWRETLLPPAPELAVPTDRPRPALPSFEGARVVRTLPRAELDRLKALAAGEGATLYMVLLAAFQSVLHRWSGQDDLVTGSAIAGRTRSETEGVIGYFSAALPLRTRFVAGESFRALLGRVRTTVLGALEHQDVPFEALVHELKEQGRPGHAPLFQVVLTMQENQGGRLELDGVEVTPHDVESGATKFELTLLPTERPDGRGLELVLWYRTDLFEAATAERMLGHLATFLNAAAAAPETAVDALPLLTAAERAQLAAWNDTAVDEGTPATVVSLFESQAARVPGRLAVAAGSVALTYAELNARANRLARHLQSLGVAANAPVGLLLDRSADAIVGLLGIMKAGGAYVPLSVDAPAARVAQQIGESGAKVVVTHAAFAERVPTSATAVALDRDAASLGALADEDPAPAASPESLAYVLYTSGSTGVPKGVAVTHANVVHYWRAVSRVMGVDANDPADGRARQYGLGSTIAADLGNTSLYGALLTGGTLHVLSKEVTTEPERYAQYMSAHQLDVLKLAPNHLRALVAGRSGGELAAVLPRQWVVVGGEALVPDFARQILAAGGCRLLNHYGPTETTVGVCTFEVTAESLERVVGQGAQTVPLGRPLPNTRCYVLDAYGNEQPVGVPGEHAIGGAGVTRGYLNRPELTAEKFVAFRNERVYRSGDRVRRLPDGEIEFLGRFDFQVKVRGYRVELGEIEQVLRAHPGVESAVVVLRAEDGAEPQLVAYAVAKQGGYAVSHTDRPTPERLREWVAAQLPDYMVPAVVVPLERLPLTPNGKVDKAQLPAPNAAAQEAEDRHVAPATETEVQLAAIWAEVLKKERVGATDNFLALGGHSLLAIRILGKLSRAFGVRLPLRTLFDAPTVQQLARHVDDARAAAASSAQPGA